MAAHKRGVRPSRSASFTSLPFSISSRQIDAWPFSAAWQSEVLPSCEIIKWNYSSFIRNELNLIIPHPVLGVDGYVFSQEKLNTSDVASLTGMVKRRFHLTIKHAEVWFLLKEAPIVGCLFNSQFLSEIVK